MWIAIVTIAIALIIGISIGMKRRSESNALVESGRMLRRNISFVDQRERFDLQHIEFAALVSAVANQKWEGTGVKVQRLNGENPALFFERPNSWKATLKMEKSEPDRSRYSFNFNSWNTYSDIPQDMNSMNITLTNVEKAMLQLDPATSVSTEQLKIDTRLR